jgi:hypothetical protein
MTVDSSHWRKSSFSGGNGGNCVEVAPSGAVRDSKNPTGGTLTAGTLHDLISAVKHGRVRP